MNDKEKNHGNHERWLAASIYRFDQIAEGRAVCEWGIPDHDGWVVRRLRSVELPVWRRAAGRSLLQRSHGCRPVRGAWVRLYSRVAAVACRAPEADGSLASGWCRNP